MNGYVRSMLQPNTVTSTVPEFLEDAIYRENYRYPLIMRHGVHQYNFLPLRSFATPVEVWKALSQYAEGMQTLWDHLAEYAPSACERIRTQWRCR